MRDDLFECTAAPQNLKTQKILYTVYNVFFIIGCVVIALLLYLCLILDISAIPSLLIFAAFFLIFTLVCFFIKRRMLLYFDYTYVSGEVRIVKVISGKTRKKFIIVQCRDIYKIGKVGSDAFEKIYGTPGVKKKIATPNGLNAANQLYYIAAKIDGENLLIVLECEEALLSYVVKYSGRSIVEENYDK